MMRYLSSRWPKLQLPAGPIHTRPHIHTFTRTHIHTHTHTHTHSYTLAHTHTHTHTHTRTHSHTHTHTHNASGGRPHMAEKKSQWACSSGSRDSSAQDNLALICSYACTHARGNPALSAINTQTCELIIKHERRVILQEENVHATLNRIRAVNSLQKLQYAKPTKILTSARST